MTQMPGRREPRERWQGSGTPERRWGPPGRGPGQSPLAAAASGPSGKHSCLITQQECTPGSPARLRHGHERGCSQLAPPHRASTTPPWLSLWGKVTACHPRDRLPHTVLGTHRRAAGYTEGSGVLRQVLGEKFLKDASTRDLSCVKKVLLEALR